MSAGWCASRCTSVYSVSHRAAGHDLLSELSEGNSAVLVLVHFLDDLGGLLVAHVEAARLDQAAELFARDGTAVVHVEGVEGIVNIEVGLALESLADGLGGDLTTEVLSPHGAELQLSVWHEAVVAAVQRVAVVRATALAHRGVVSIEGEHGVAELAHVETAVTSGIVAGDEKVELLAGGEHADGGETLAQVSHRDATEVVHVEDLEGVRQVEVGLQSQGSLLALNLVLSLDKVTETVDKLVFITEGKDRLSRGARVAREGLGGDASGRGVAVGRGGAQRRRVARCRESAGGGLGAQGARVARLEESATVSLRGGGTLARLHHATAGRAGGADELSELRVGELGVTVGVDAAHDSEKLSLAGVVADRAEEGTEVEGVDPAVVVAVNATVGGKGREVVADLDLTLQDVEAAHKVNLFLEDVKKGAFDVVRERVEAAHTQGGSVESDVSHQVVRAGKQHLQEVLEGESAVLVGVEEADQTVGLRLRHGEVALVAEEVKDLDRTDESVAVSIESLEGGVGCEVADGGEALAGGLKTSLAVAHGDQ
mmetsp:Transcript_15028/g.18995  ORF Transcript_15028/g.18995 Transcript_15028/m.18995 type:complete len:542 (-) Transcript_15028:51-1676(-)